MSDTKLTSKSNKKTLSSKKSSSKSKTPTQNVSSYIQSNDNKQKIINLFMTNVKGKEICIDSYNQKHCGKEGHWLEKQFGIAHNANNEADIYGYEMKKSAPKTTLGDFSASEYAFSPISKRPIITAYNSWDNISLSRKEFLQYFGNSNPKKNNRYSWSGSVVPIYDNWNIAGQNLQITDTNDIVIYYSYSRDKRDRKTEFPDYIKNQDQIIVAIWKADKMKQHIDKKFNQKGFFICEKVNNRYERILFGKPFTFDFFIESIKNKKVFFDSGMYDGNIRNYSQFRGTASFWYSMITEEYS